MNAPTMTKTRAVMTHLPSRDEEYRTAVTFIVTDAMTRAEWESAR
jgi:hypothetical protein